MYEDNWGDDPTLASPKQRYVLRRIMPDLPDEDVVAMPRQRAWQLINDHSRNWRGYSPTPHQERFLRNWCQWTAPMTRGEASDKIAAIKARIANMTPDQVSNEIALAQDNWLNRGRSHNGEPGAAWLAVHQGGTIHTEPQI